MHTEQTIFLIGIGGIGMSALARYFLYYGYKVGGYDRVKTPITEELELQGATIIYKDDPSLLHTSFTHPAPLTIIYTPAIKIEESALRQYFQEKGYSEFKRAKVLGEISKKHKALCVAGTHGKTTTSTLLAHLLKESQIGVNAFLGGLSLNEGSNLLLDTESPYVVVEADEYDRSFHQLKPYSSIITSIEPDHLDIYKTAVAFEEAFQHFASLNAPDGMVLCHDSYASKLQTPQLKTYGTKNTSDYYYSNLKYLDGELYFSWHHPNGVLEDLHLGTPIEINVLNATAAIALAYEAGVKEEELRRGLSSFKGVHRRFERTIFREDLILVDDYAHHPDEILASLTSLRKLYPFFRLTVVFQPHLYSRTKDFLPDFGRALSLADEVVLLPIYPAREHPIPGVTSDAILPYITATKKSSLQSKEELYPYLKERAIQVLIMMGAGDIEFEVSKVKALFANAKK